ncbi:hypothetical protein [Paenarthrobacter nitroguajacolicus]|uniref:hypothetical protein n=1 Tax=Paenarthrobacter nitroguajacolicus TaxID=211146 RepID=UPI002119155C|nr:hypothetical protein [Paenarthrobacter nitroguajacolicus]
MGVEDSIRKATENAMEDLAGTSDPVNDGRVPEPGEKDDDIQVHSSISEGSNAMDEDLSPNDTQRSHTATGDAPRHRDTGHTATPDGGTHQDAETDADASAGSGDVSGPAGLPSGDPDDLRADPSEGGGDPSTSMGRG